MRKIFTLVFSSLLCACGSSDSGAQQSFSSLGEADTITVSVESSLHHKLYLHQRTWGLTADKRRIFISPNRELEADQALVYFDYDSFFYRFSKDTLFLVTRKKSPIPKGIPNEFVLIQKEIDNLDFQNTYNQGKYKQLGYRKIDER